LNLHAVPPYVGSHYQKVYMKMNNALWFIVREENSICETEQKELFCDIVKKVKTIGRVRYDHHNKRLNIYKLL